jgi:hypothetical protein
MPICPEHLRYNEVLIPIVIRNLIKNDLHFQSLFTDTNKVTRFEIYPFTLFDKPITLAEKKCFVDGTSNSKRALAIYSDNDIKYKEITSNVREAYQTVFVEILILVDSENLEDKAKQDALLISKDLEYTLFNQNKSLNVVIANPFTSENELFNIQKIKIISNEPLLKGSINNKGWTFIHLIELQICTNV